YITLLFFFSSRRRHTRCYRDWSSDVCSSDLKRGVRFRETSSRFLQFRVRRNEDSRSCPGRQIWELITRRAECRAELGETSGATRSEERRVGKEWRYRGGAGGEKGERSDKEGT